MGWEQTVKEFWTKQIPQGGIDLSLSFIKALCPPCAERMEFLGVASLKLDGKQMPEGMKQGLCDKFGPDEGFFGRCVDGVSSDISDKEAFCAWLHHECLGKWPSESAEPVVATDFEKALRIAELNELEAYRAGKGPAPIIYKAEGRKALEQEAGQLMVFVASEESEDRLGDTILINGWVLDGFSDSVNRKSNPVFMFNHDHSIPPIGMVPRVWSDGRQLLNTVRFDMADPFAAFVAGKYERGFMRAESVGFRVLEFEQKPGGRGLVFKRQELLEISAVAIPSHPAAIRKALGERRFSIIVPEKMPIPNPDQIGTEQGGGGLAPATKIMGEFRRWAETRLRLDKEE